MEELIKEDGKLYKKLRHVTIDTKSESFLSKGKVIPSIFFCPNHKRYCEKGEIYQHLYVLAQEVILEGDWAYSFKDKCVFRFDYHSVVVMKSVSDAVRRRYSKVIATSNEALGITMLSETFLKAYCVCNPFLKTSTCNLYKKRRLMVEYREYCNADCPEGVCCHPEACAELKANAPKTKNNELIIKI